MSDTPVNSSTATVTRSEAKPTTYVLERLHEFDVADAWLPVGEYTAAPRMRRDDALKAAIAKYPDLVALLPKGPIPFRIIPADQITQKTAGTDAPPPPTITLS